MAYRKSLCDDAAEKIKNIILDGTYKQGDRLPNEYELAEICNVSRFTIREAMKEIAMLGLVEIEKGRGTFVSNQASSSLMQTLLPLIMFDKNSLAEIMEARIPICR